MVGGVQVACGITARDLPVRESERRHRMGIPNLYLEPVGPRVTQDAAEEWERRNRCPPHNRRRRQGS
jgi:hypothetical protein